MAKIAVIRIKGMVGLNKDIAETLHRLRLRKKYVCVVLDNPSETQMGMVKAVRNCVAYGEISAETYKQLKEMRGKDDPNNKGNLKPYFRLHPPRGGIDSKLHFGVKKGVLGDNKDKINDLLERML